MVLGPWLMIGVCNFECTRVLHESLLKPVLMYGSETMIGKERERSRIRTIHMDDLRGWIGIKRMDSPECMNKRVVWTEERIDEGVLWWFNHVERME